MTEGIPPLAEEWLVTFATALREGDPTRAAHLLDTVPHLKPAETMLAALLADRRPLAARMLAATTPRDVQSALRGLGLSAADAGAVDSACALAAAPEAEPPRVHLASLLLVGGQSRIAEALLLPAWRGAETSALVARALSGTWMLLGQEEQALQAARIAGQAAPRDAEVQAHLAGLLLRAGQPAPALMAAGRAVGADPDSHAGWRLASSALLELGYAEEAVTAANQAARLSPMHGGHAEELRTASAADLEPPRAVPPLASRPAAPSSSWAVLPESLPRPPHVSFRLAIAARLRIVNALMLRETRTQSGTGSLGYAWALFEPMSHILLLAVVFYFLGHDSEPPIGDSMLVFYMTGVLAFLFFAHLTERAMDLPVVARALLNVPAVRLFDVLASRAALSACTDLVVAALTCLLLIALGVGTLPAHLGWLLACYAILFLLSLGLACTNLVVSSHSQAWERLWPSFLRVQYFTCGVFYHPLAMPEDVRALVLLNPMLHVTEWMREGWYPGYDSPFLDIGYLLRWTLGALALGSLLFAAYATKLRHHV